MGLTEQWSFPSCSPPVDPRAQQAPRWPFSSPWDLVLLDRIGDTLSSMVVNLWRYRGFIARNALSDVRNRYAGSAMGVAWHVLNPLAQILIYSLVFSHLMAPRVPGGGSGAAFALYLCAGLLPWTAFSAIVCSGAPIPSSRTRPI